MFSRRGLMIVLPVLILLATGSTRLAAQERTMGLMYHDSTRSFQGYTLFASLNYDVTYLIDNQGRLVHSWDPDRPPHLSVYLLADGSLLHTAGAGVVTGLNVRTWNDDELWVFNYQGDSFFRHHDACQLPNGNILSVVAEYRSEAEALASGRDPARLDSTGLLPEYIVEINRSTNRVVWEWRSWDHMVQDYDSTRRNYGDVPNRPDLIDINYTLGPTSQPRDFMHANAVAYNAQYDQVVFSPRNYSEVWVIDHSTTTEQARGHTGGRYGKGGDLLYRWGNPASYRRGNPGRHRIYYQHAPHWIDDSLPGAGHMLVFSNGGTERPWSEAVEWAPPMDSLGFYRLNPDSTFGPVEPSWVYRDTNEFYSQFISNCQRLPNGNTLICEGTTGTFIEVTPDSQVVWKYISPVNARGPMRQGDSIPLWANAVFRCYRYSPGYSAFQGRTLVPGDPIELPPVGAAEPGERIGPEQPTLSAARLVRDRAAIFLSLPVAADVELAVYDTRGALVATLTSGRLATGEHRFNWNAASSPSGVYRCRLSYGNSVSGVKLLKLE